MQTINRNAEIIELHVGGLPMMLIADQYGISLGDVDTICSLYTSAISCDITLPSKVNYSSKDWFIYDSWAKLSQAQMANILGVSVLEIKRVGKKLGLKRKDRIVTKSPEFAHRLGRTLLLNLQTGIYYTSNLEACHTISMNVNTFKNRINGYRYNSTSFIQV